MTSLRVVAAGVFVIGLLARLAVVVHGAGFGSNLGYDPGVYFAAADGLVHGRLPYRDFVLLHPPGLMLALTPFALATRFSTDRDAFIAANVAFSCLGAFNAAFVVLIGRRFGLSLPAAGAGGLFAALWLGSVHAEDMARLEPLANLFVLVAMCAYAETRRSPSASWLFAMGAALGAATSVKIWYVVPLVVLLGSVAARVSRRHTLVAVSGVATSVLAINGVFFLRAPSAMWHMVVLDQLGRARFAASPITRFDQANDIVNWDRVLGVLPTAVAVVALLLGSGLLLRAAWTRPLGRVLVILVVVQLIVLAVSPSWFAFYADYLTPALALALATGVEAIRSRRWRSQWAARHPVAVGRTGAAAALVALVVLVAPLCWQRVGTAFPRTRLAESVAATRCVTADSPMALIELNALSRSFSRGCQDWVDVVGRTYGVDRMNVARADNPSWQRDVKAYLLSGDAFIVIRRGTGLSSATRAALEGRSVVARVGGYVIFRGRSTGG